MAVNQQFGSIKRTLVAKDNQKVFLAMMITSFVVVFSLVASNSLIKQMSYQNKVISERKKSLQVIKTSVENTVDLQASYVQFNKQNPNLIGGNTTGTGDRDGTNSKIVLDALPAVYNFPALATSIEKIVTADGLEFESMTGNDDAVAQQQNETSSSPKPIDMPFEMSVKGSYNASQTLMKDLERSIRPFSITRLRISAEGDGGMVVTSVAGKTYFQPQKNLKPVTEKVTR